MGKLFIIIAVGALIYAISKAWLIIPAGLVLGSVLLLIFGVFWILKR